MSQPAFRTGLATLMASGSAPLIILHSMTMKRRVPFRQLHRYPPVYSLRVHWVPLFPSSQRLGAFAFSSHPGVHGFPVLRLLRPIRHFLRPRGFVGVGRIRARCLAVRLPNPPVGTVRAAFVAHGSRDREFMVTSISSGFHRIHGVQLARSLSSLYRFPTLSLRAFALYVAFPHSD